MQGETGHKNIYESSLQTELERLKHADFAHPFYVSAKLLEDESLAGKQFLDVGSGPDPKLREFVRAQNGKYSALDFNQGHLEALQKSAKPEDFGISLIRADAKALPIKPESVDLAHERFVLMHLLPGEREKVIREMVDASKDTVLFLEYNWETLKSENYPDLIAEFKACATEIMLKIGIESQMGKILESEIKNALKGKNYEQILIKAQDFQRNGKFGKEIVAMLKSLTEVSEKILKDEQMKKRLQTLEVEFSKVSDDVSFTPPAIQGITVKKLSNNYE